MWQTKLSLKLTVTVLSLPLRSSWRCTPFFSRTVHSFGLLRRYTSTVTPAKWEFRAVSSKCSACRTMSAKQLDRAERSSSGALDIRTARNRAVSASQVEPFPGPRKKYTNVCLQPYFHGSLHIDYLSSTQKIRPRPNKRALSTHRNYRPRCHRRRVPKAEYASSPVVLISL